MHPPVTARHSILALPLLLATGACASGAPETPARESTARAVPEDLDAIAARLAADVAWLADDARGGRRAGTPGEREAGLWIAERFRALGLEPAGTDGFLQPFEVPLPARDGGGSEVAWSGGTSEAGEGRLAPLFCSSAGNLEGELVLCGYGVADADLLRDDFGDVDGHGRIALIVRGTPPYAPGEQTGPGATPREPDQAAPDGWAGAGSIFVKVMNAKRRGFGAVLLAQHPDDADPPPAFDPSRSALAGIPAVAIDAALAGELTGGAYAERVRASDAARRVEAPLVLEGPVRVVADVERARGTASNVLGLVRGERADQVVVIGAHLDHLGDGGEGSLAPDQHGEVHNGADDNASGTAVVLELARRWAGRTPPVTLCFALWSGEELGLLGSEHWASHPTVPLERVVANVNLDMVGRAGDGELAVLGAGSSPPFEAWMEPAGRRAGLDLDVSLSGQGLGGSDHQVFLRRRIPALHLFSGVHADYHRPSDDAERFEAEGAARVALLAEDLALRIAYADSLAFVEPVIDRDAPAAAPRERGWSVWFGTVPASYADEDGLRLAGTSPGSPAEKAGLLAGDVIVQVGDVEIDTIHDFVYMLQVYKPGDVVLARYLRDGEPHEVRITLATRDAE